MSIFQTESHMSFKKFSTNQSKPAPQKPDTDTKPAPAQTETANELEKKPAG